IGSESRGAGAPADAGARRGAETENAPPVGRIWARTIEKWADLRPRPPEDGTSFAFSCHRPGIRRATRLQAPTPPPGPPPMLMPARTPLLWPPAPLPTPRPTPLLWPPAPLPTPRPTPLLWPPAPLPTPPPTPLLWPPAPLPAPTPTPLLRPPAPSPTSPPRPLPTPPPTPPSTPLRLTPAPTPTLHNPFLGQVPVQRRQIGPAGYVGRFGLLQRRAFQPRTGERRFLGPDQRRLHAGLDGGAVHQRLVAYHEALFRRHADALGNFQEVLG